MSGSLKVLAGETVVYGVSTMLGRFLNWLLMPFYIRTILPDEYGVIVNIYGIISILLVVFTYGLETGFFRFSRKGEKSNVLVTTLLMIGSTSLLFILLIYLSANNLSNYYYNGDYSNSIILVGIIVAFDCFLAIPFANLRLNNQALKFGLFKIGNISLSIFFNLFFLLFLPYLIKIDLVNNNIVEVFNKGNGVFYILLSNALSSAITFFFFWSEYKLLTGKFQFSLLISLLKYSWPVLVVGITGMVIQNIDKVLLPSLLGENGFKELAVYGANFKIGVLMGLFTQSFRFAFEPYFFKIQEKGKDSYAKVMEYFIFFGVLIFLGVMLFIDVINILLTKEYLYGNVIIPYVLLGQLFYGIYFNLSLWYKLTDKTIYGAIFGIGGTIITVSFIYFLVPTYGIIGGAMSIMIGYGVMMIVSYFIGQKHYAIPYSLSKIGLIVLLGVLVYLANMVIYFDSMMFRYLFKGIIFVFYVFLFLFINKTISYKNLSLWLKLKL